MINLGKFNSLTVCRTTDSAVYLDGGEECGEILLLDKDLPTHYQVGDVLEAFAFIDGHNQALATLKAPKAQVDEVAWLKVVSLSHAGAFMDWGLSKDLLVPFSEQKTKMIEGRSYLVRLFLDESNRIAASTLLDDFIKEQAFYFKEGQAVDLIIAEATDLGFKAIINHQYWGLLYKNEIFQTLQFGQHLTGYIKKIREDNKIDLALNQDKYAEKVDSTSEMILRTLQKHGGYIALTDKSPPEMIYDTFGVSKKVFKQAIGGLYKQRKIVIEDKGLRATPQDN